jgi:hypothetical protein
MATQRNETPMRLAKIVKHCRVDKPRHFKLADHDPAERFGLSTDIEDVKRILADSMTRIEELQQRLYAEGRWGVLIVLQGMDAAGKDGVVKHVMSGIDPQGCEVHSFKAPVPRNSRTISCGGSARPYRRVAASAFSIAPIMRRCWWCGCIRTCWSGRTCRQPLPARTSGSTASRKFVPSSIVSRATARWC